MVDLLNGGFMSKHNIEKYISSGDLHYLVKAAAGARSSVNSKKVNSMVKRANTNEEEFESNMRSRKSSDFLAKTYSL